MQIVSANKWWIYLHVIPSVFLSICLSVFFFASDSECELWPSFCTIIKLKPQWFQCQLLFAPFLPPTNQKVWGVSSGQPKKTDYTVHQTSSNHLYFICWNKTLSKIDNCFVICFCWNMLLPLQKDKSSKASDLRTEHGQFILQGRGGGHLVSVENFLVLVWKRSFFLGGDHGSRFNL